ncbi:hypothetical protein FJTKL_15301 [Diaporthe vaccinii]|uniref:Uncharacterized protein n=1 Tax=Diaporthe vaccinii TaxID=105482 RepID=A0ABR4E5B7_9PEZI
MATTKSTTLPQERRKGEAALSDFADYVEKQQAIRFPSAKPTATGAAAAAAQDDHEAELDDILNALDLSDKAPLAPLHKLLLRTDDESLQKLVELLTSRIEEGHGETLFDIGFEHNGESMHLDKEGWDKA